jgi:DNA-binding PadR family transcriptional regulator
MIRGHLKVMILSLMLERDVTGYDIAKYLQQHTGEKPSFGSIYPVLKSMVTDGLAHTKTIKNKKFYRITIKGRTFLKELSGHKTKIIREIRDGFMAFQTISKEDCEFFTLVIDTLDKGHMPLQGLSKERLQIMITLLELEQRGLFLKNQTKIKAILVATTKKLQALH